VRVIEAGIPAKESKVPVILAKERVDAAPDVKETNSIKLPFERASIPAVFNLVGLLLAGSFIAFVNSSMV
jgi:hypothetical protein